MYSVSFIFVKFTLFPLNTKKNKKEFKKKNKKQTKINEQSKLTYYDWYITFLTINFRIANWSRTSSF